MQAQCKFFSFFLYHQNMNWHRSETLFLIFFLLLWFRSGISEMTDHHEDRVMSRATKMAKGKESSNM